MRAASLAALLLLAGCLGPADTTPAPPEGPALPAEFAYVSEGQTATFRLEPHWTWTSTGHAEYGLLARTSTVGDGLAGAPPSLASADGCGRLQWLWLETFKQGLGSDSSGKVEPKVVAMPGAGGDGLLLALSLRRDALPAAAEWTPVAAGAGQPTLWAQSTGPDAWKAEWVSTGWKPGRFPASIVWPAESPLPTRLAGWTLASASATTVPLASCRGPMAHGGTWERFGPTERPLFGAWLPEAVELARGTVPQLIAYELQHPDLYLMQSQFGGTSEGAVDVNREGMFLTFTHPGATDIIVVLCLGDAESESTTATACIHATDSDGFAAAPGYSQAALQPMLPVSSMVAPYHASPQFTLNAHHLSAFFAFVPPGGTFPDDIRSAGFDLVSGHWTFLDGWAPEELLNPPGGWP